MKNLIKTTCFKSSNTRSIPNAAPRRWQEISFIRKMRQFYLVYPKAQVLSAKPKSKKQQTLSVEFQLSWSHYLKLMWIDDENERKFYEIEAVKNNWSIRELQ